MSDCKKCIPVKINGVEYGFVFKCKNCDKLYYKCCFCEEGNFLLEVIGEKNTFELCEDLYYTCKNYPGYMEDVDKGIFCEKCKYHFCAVCWQHTGILTEDDLYICEECNS